MSSLWQRFVSGVVDGSRSVMRDWGGTGDTLQGGDIRPKINFVEAEFRKNTG